MRSAPLLLVGCGRWGHNILRDLVSLGHTVIVVDPSPEARAAAASMARVTRPNIDIDEHVSGIIVATPASLHIASIERVARWRQPIFVEKPLATRIEDAEHALELAGDHLFVMDKWRYHPGIEALGELARNGELGPVRAIRTWRLGRHHGHEDVDPIWTLLPHDLSILREVLGYLPSAVDAVAERADGRVWGMAARLGSGPICTSEVSAHRVEHRRRIEVAFDGAVAIFDGERDTIVEIRSGDDRRTLSVTGDPPLRRELDAFVKYLDGGAPPKSSGHDGVDSVRRIAELRRLAGIDD
jgi:predicted dehydrogenase